MQGFVENYATDSRNVAQGENVMKCFHAALCPYSPSWPSNTRYAITGFLLYLHPHPQPAFRASASSGDSLTQDGVLAPAAAKTIFQIIDDPNNDATYRIYSSGATILMANIYLAHHQNKFFDYSRFTQDCEDNLLPEYTFIEPAYDYDLNNGIFCNSQHPDFAVYAGGGAHCRGVQRPAPQSELERYPSSKSFPDQRPDLVCRQDIL